MLCYYLLSQYQLICYENVLFLWRYSFKGKEFNVHLFMLLIIIISQCWTSMIFAKIWFYQTSFRALASHSDKGLTLKTSAFQCRSKGNIGGGARERRRCEPLGGCEKFWNLEAWKCYFQRSPRAIRDLRISRIIYFVHSLSKPIHIQSMALATSITK